MFKTFNLSVCVVLPPSPLGCSSYIARCVRVHVAACCKYSRASCLLGLLASIVKQKINSSGNVYGEMEH